MNEQEINKTIAEYMGWSKSDMSYHCRGGVTKYKWTDGSGDLFLSKDILPREYTKSLNDLVPVVDKINGYDDLFNLWNCVPHAMYNKISPSLALATACLKVIKEINT